MKKLMLLIAVMLLLVGCGKKEQTPIVEGDTNTTQDSVEVSKDDTTDAAQNQQKEEYSFDSNGVTVNMNAEAAPIILALGEPQDYFEAASCAFQGLDKFYYYNGFEVDTYPLDGVDYVSSVVFSDDSVSTKEGIYIGSTLEEIIAAYGEDYTEESGIYTYTKGKSQLAFVIENNAAKSITYLAVVEGLQ